MEQQLAPDSQCNAILSFSFFNFDGNLSYVVKSFHLGLLVLDLKAKLLLA